LKIGDQFLLVAPAPYTMFGGHEEDPGSFITVTVTEELDSEGEFTGEKGKGYLAKGSDGYNYGYNYPRVNEGYGTTPWCRYMPDKEFLALSTEDKDKLVAEYLWSDVTKFQCPKECFESQKLDFISFCETHQKHYYVRKGCFYCKHIPDHKNQVVMNEDDHSWKGWY